MGTVSFHRYPRFTHVKVVVASTLPEEAMVTGLEDFGFGELEAPES